MIPPANPIAAAARDVLDRLRGSGHVAYFAGGCVRDMLLGATPKDFDVATDAYPPRVLELFPKARLVGAKFGVVLVRKRSVDVEVATFRADGDYSDGRHPDSVVFGGEIDDARRRDFTINGLFLDPATSWVIDHIGGQADLQARIIRTIGDPERRFGEDHLRMLRAVRFAARLGFSVDPATAAAIRDHAIRLRQISPERIWMELEQILAAPTRASAWRWIVDFGLTPHLVEDWTPSPSEIRRIGDALSCLPSNSLAATLSLAIMFRPDSATVVEQRGRNMRLSNKLIAGLRWLVESAARIDQDPNPSLADLKILMGGADWSGLLELLLADRRAAGQSVEPIERLAARADAIRPDRIAPPPLLTGDDLSAMGVTPGPNFGRILEAVYRAQLNEEIETKEQAMERAIRFKTED